MDQHSKKGCPGETNADLGTLLQCRNSSDISDQSCDSSDDLQQFSKGIVKSKPSIEIYRPPNLRKGQVALTEPGGSSNSDSNAQFYKAPGFGRPLNVYAKEFKFNPQQQKSVGDCYTNSAHLFQRNGIYSSTEKPLGYPLLESKSSSRILGGFRNDYDYNNDSSASSSNSSIGPRFLQQSKSSNHIPVKPKHQQGLFQQRVRFYDELFGEEDENSNSHLEVDQQEENLSDSLSGLKIKHASPGLGSTTTFFQAFPIAETASHQFHPLQKSQSTYYTNTVSLPVYTATVNLVKGRSKSFKAYSNPNNPNPKLNNSNNNAPGHNYSPIKRSKSFGPSKVSSSPSNAYYKAKGRQEDNHDVWELPIASFELNKWPKQIQEIIKTALGMGFGGNGNISAAKYHINMVTQIFQTVLEEQNSALVVPALNILVYFIQTEKYSTILETFINTTFATFQKLFPKNHSFVTNSSQSQQWTIFLKLLSEAYSKVKGLQLKNSNNPKEMQMLQSTVLSLLCDSCLGILHSPIEFYTTDLMESLFTVVTTNGPAMDLNYTSKMKGILASVRDLLLGLRNPSANPLPTYVQKTLMQLIELHAANWLLPASALRYYYSKN